MKDFVIRTNKTTSKQSNEVNNSLDVNLTNTSKLGTLSDYSDIIDAYRVFEDERSKSNSFRLIFTINPYCTNVLFNAITEIIKDEGSNTPSVINSNKDSIVDFSENKYVVGNKNPQRWEMVMNTEYSKPEIGYEYKPGFDIFTNHILRNKTFKMVNHMSKQGVENGTTRFISIDGAEKTYYSSKIEDQQYIFNTIGDNLRYDDTNIVKYFRRTRIPDETTYKKNEERNKHLYDHLDLLSFEESMVNNLTEDYGWVGFTNNSSIGAKEYNGGEDGGKDTNSSKILNNHEGCEFIDMYPDRTLFSFNPKYNEFKKRFEYNWDVCITYPFENYTNHKLVKGGKLLILSVEKMLGPSNENIVMFRTYVNHGLKRGEQFKLYDENGEEKGTYKVVNIGNLKNEEKEYYFYTNDDELAEGIGVNAAYRFTRFVKNCESEYYFRVFRKLPNLKRAHLALDDETAKNNTLLYGGSHDEIGGYIGKNAKKEDGTRTFDNEMYRLAFARTIYNDLSTQVTFTDTIDVNHFVDNRKRPLTKLYFTIVKRNKGNEEWYGNEPNYGSDNVEFSHCFGKVTSGIEMSTEEIDALSIRQKKAGMGDVRLLNNLKLYESHSLEDNITIDGTYIENELWRDCFLGDLVEYNRNEVMEHTLAWVNHRFNTMQRELPSDDNTKYNDCYYQEIVSDDYDVEDFAVRLYEATGMEVDGYGTLKPWQRPEGYYYKPHYEISIKEFGQIQQSSHFTINLDRREDKTVNVEYMNGRLFVKALSRANVTVGDTVIISTKDEELFGVVFDVYSNYTFTVVLDPAKYELKEDIETKTKGLENCITDIRRKNEEIPYYAENVKGTSNYLWRNVICSGENGTVDLPEYTFSNGAFYIHTGINFFLKRQDPKNWVGMQCSNAYPNDIGGNIMQSSIYDYKDETYFIC